MFFGKVITAACFVLSQRVQQEPNFVKTHTSLSALTEIEDIAVEVPGSKYKKLLDWIKSNGGTVSEKLNLLPSKLRGYGAFVTEDVKKDDVLVTIPRGSCVSVDDVLSDPDSSDTFKKLMDQAGPGGNTVALAGIMAKERLISQAKKSSEDGKFGPYLDTLPWERGTNNQEHMLFWSDEDVEKYLDGTMCYGEATSLREEVNLAINVLNKIIGESILQARGEITDTNSGFSLPWEKKTKKLEGLVEGLPEAVKGAFVIILTRAFQDEGKDDTDAEKLVPLLDMLQHSDEPNIRHAMKKADGTVEVRAARDLKAGEELLNQYRPEEELDMPYHRFFTRYGFVPGISESILNLLNDKSSIFVAQKAEV